MRVIITLVKHRKELRVLKHMPRSVLRDVRDTATDVSFYVFFPSLVLHVRCPIYFMFLHI